MKRETAEYILDASTSKARDIVLELMDRFDKWQPYLYHVALTGSAYIKFPHWGLGSIRVADHKGREKYRYRWNVDTRKSQWGTYKRFKDRGTLRVVCGGGMLQTLQEEFEFQAAQRGITPGTREEWKERVHAES